MSDRELTDLLALAAGAAPAPVGAPPVPDDVGAGAGPVDDVVLSAGGRRRWTRPLAAAAAVAVALAVGAQVLDDPETDPVAAPSGTASTDDEVCPNCDTPTAVPTPVGSGVGGGGATPGSATAGMGAGAGASQGGAGLAATPRIVHNGTITIEVDDGAFAPTVERVTSITTGLGGFVTSTQTAESGDAPSGSLTVRVPAAAFEPLLAEVRRLGDVQSVTTSGEDVTAQYVDVEARLGALRATRDQFLAVLAEAEAIGDILAVQDRINIVNVEIESLEGQRRVLEDLSALGTLTVTIAEPGAREPAEAAVTDGDGGIGGAWDEARRGFGNAIEWFVARSGKALVLAAVALALLAVGQLALRRLRRRAL